MVERDRWRDERAAAAIAIEPTRRLALAAGPALRDVEAAIDCSCSCPPRPAESELHGGGVACPCQLTPTERTDAWDEIFALVGDIGDDDVEVAAVARFATAAADLGVRAEVVVNGAPFVIAGTCDGRGFYLRERGGVWRVTLASDENPAADPWTMDIEQPTIDVATGTEVELWDEGASFSPERALRVAVEAVRDALARNGCAHELPLDAGHRFCRRCGVALADADRWRWRWRT